MLGHYALHNSTLPIVTNVGPIIHVSSPQNAETSLHNGSCNSNEEADGRIILHTNDMVLHGARSVLICSSDTDVVVLAVSFFNALRQR